MPQESQSEKRSIIGSLLKQNQLYGNAIRVVGIVLEQKVTKFKLINTLIGIGKVWSASASPPLSGDALPSFPTQTKLSFTASPALCLVCDGPQYHLWNLVRTVSEEISHLNWGSGWFSKLCVKKRTIRRDAASSFLDVQISPLNPI